VVESQHANERQANIVSDAVVREIVSKFSEQNPNSNSDIDQTFFDTWGNFVPSESIVKSVVQAAFWAGQSQEEGRTTPVRICLVEPRNSLCYLAPKALSPEVLRKLSPFLDDENSWLYVNQKLEIVGVGPRPIMRTLSIFINQYRTLVVSDQNLVLALMEAGTWHVIDNDRFGIANVIATTFLEAFPEDFPQRFARASLICDLAVATRRRGRGAIFVFLPESNSVGIGLPSYRAERFDATTSAFEKWTLRKDAAKTAATPDHLSATGQVLFFV
jgi:hypothetical protein